MILKFLKILKRTNIKDIQYFHHCNCRDDGVKAPLWQKYYDEIRIGNNIILREMYNWDIDFDYNLDTQYTVKINDVECLLRGINQLIYYFAYRLVKKKERLEAKEERRACKEAINNSVKSVKNELDKLAK